MIDQARPITATSFDRLSQLLNSRPLAEDSFLSSPTYLIHTGRRGLWLLEREGDFATFCRHPNREGVLLVFPPPGTLNPALLQDMCSQLSAHTERVELSRVHHRHRQRMSTMAGFERADEAVLDWRFPCAVLSNGGLSELAEPKYKRLRPKVRPFEDRVQVRAVDAANADELRGAVFDLIDRWAHLVAERKMFSPAELVAPNRNAYGLAAAGFTGINMWALLLEGRAIAAFSSSYPSLGGPVNGITMCVDRELKGASEVAHQHMARLHLLAGHAETNVNGSETQSLDEFRTTLRPLYRYQLDTYRWL